MIVKLKICTTDKTSVEMSLSEIDYEQEYICNIYIYYIKFEFYLKPYLINLGI